MSRLLTASGIEKAFGDRVILRGCDLVVDAGERVGLVGANGSGKSTLLRILSGQTGSDHGSLSVTGQLTLLDQEPELAGRTVGDAADAALQWHRDLFGAWQEALERDDDRESAKLQARLDLVGWELGHEVDAMLGRVVAPPRDRLIETLSGGERRRVALAVALLSRPDVLILDEPTNHLDSQTIDWLQAWLANYAGAVIIVTHDRYLLEGVADRIVEVEDGVTVSYAGSYTDYLIERAERRAAMARAEDKRLAMITKEAEWASRSPAARTTKQKGRLQRLEALKSIPAMQNARTFQLDLSTGLKTGRSVLELVDVELAFTGRTLMRSLSFNLQAGHRIGIVGPNGAGKTTLLRMLTGDLAPDKGTIHRAPKFRAALLDQHRTGLTDHDTVFEAAGSGNDHVIVGERPVHVAGFLARFLFGAKMLDQRVSTLSGGERARLLLAKLLLQGCNLLLLDEPTNDLDLQTLRVLEEALMTFDGAAVIVTHDRAFLDRVCTEVLAFHGDGSQEMYADRLQAQRAIDATEQVTVAPVKTSKADEHAARKRAQRSSRLSFKEKAELEALPGQIESLEVEMERLEGELSDPEIWKVDPERAKASATRLETLPNEIEELFTRWEALSERAS